MYRELLSEGSYDNAAEYAQLLAFAKAEFEEEVMEEEYKQEYFKQIVAESESQESDGEEWAYKTKSTMQNPQHG